MRKTGYYWVKLHNSAKWEVMMYNEKVNVFYTMCTTSPFFNSDLEAIGTRIPNPDETVRSSNVHRGALVMVTEDSEA